MMKKFHPILFSTEMVKSIQEGRKTMTRRTVKPQPEAPRAIYKDEDCYAKINENGQLLFYWDSKERLSKRITDGGFYSHQCPYGKVGDILWVRETWQKVNGNEYLFKANSFGDNLKWKPSIFMPKSACRIFLEITDIKVERLQDINAWDVQREGAGKEIRQMWLFGLNEKERDGVYRRSFQTLWQKINGAESWKSNPFVWVISFKQINKPENF